MTHYWGAREIVERIGLKKPGRLPELKQRLGVPCFLRADPRNPWRRIYYASEQMILAWELAMGKLDRERLLRKQEEKQGGL